MKKNLIKILLLIFALFTLGCGRSFVENDKDIAIVFTNDIHCGINDNIGIAGMMKYYKNLDEQNVCKALVDAGDFSQGGIEGSSSKGEIMYELMNKLGYDFMVPGNHEFDYGIQKLIDNSMILNGVIYSCNFMDLNKNATVFNPYKIIDFGNKKVAFIGICTPDTIQSTSAKIYMDENDNYIYGFSQDDINNGGLKLYDRLQNNINNAKEEGADYVILVAHMGESDYLKPYNIKTMTENIEGVDAIIDGHSHNIYNEIYKLKNGKDVPVAQAGTKMQAFGKINITKDGKVSIDIIDTVDGKDEETENMINTIEDELAIKLDKIMYENNKIVLSVNDSKGDRYVRKGETNAADFVADAYRYAGNTDIAIVNGGGVRDNINEGDIKYSDLLKINPFSNMLCICKIKGKDLLDCLEFGAKNYPEENGQFIQVSGMEYTIDSTKPSTVETTDVDDLFIKVGGEYRVCDVKINGENLDLEKEYTLTGLNYMMVNYGGGMTMFKNVEKVEDNFITDIEALENYLKVADLSKYKNIYGDGRVKIIVQ